ncbi:MAG: YggS family pyridoxal phosphate-dependent enzyme [Bacteroidota bacterium]
MHNIRSNIHTLKTELVNKPTRLVAVTKTHPNEILLEAYQEGLRDFGENKVQEMTLKHEQLPKDIRWHLIGHLQRNKVKQIIEFVHLIHSVDSFRLLREIEKRAAQAERKVEVLLQVHIADEEHKFGFLPDDLRTLLSKGDLDLEYTQIIGLMGMATFTDNEEQIRQEFKGLKLLFDEFESQTLSKNVQMKELSMGMSGDYGIAIEEGSTLVRVGSKIFGARNYNK